MIELSSNFILKKNKYIYIVQFAYIDIGWE